MGAADLELLKAFYIESGEILDRLENDLQVMESTPGDPEVINSIFRGLHTIKGNSSFLSLQSVTGLAHAAETLLDKARKKEVTVTSTMAQVVRAAFDDLKRLIVDQENVNVAPTVANIHAFMEGRKPVLAAAPAASPAAPPRKFPREISFA